MDLRLYFVALAAMHIYHDAKRGTYHHGVRFGEALRAYNRLYFQWLELHRNAQLFGAPPRG